MLGIHFWPSARSVSVTLSCTCRNSASRFVATGQASLSVFVAVDFLSAVRHSHGPCTSPVASGPGRRVCCQPSITSVGVKWHLMAIFIFISAITDDIEQLFMCLLWLCACLNLLLNLKKKFIIADLQNFYVKVSNVNTTTIFSEFVIY